MLRAWRRFWWIVAALPICFFAAAWYSQKRVQAQYRAVAVVQILDQRGALTGRLADEERGPGSSMSSLLEVLSSGAVAKEVVRAKPALTRVRAVGFDHGLIDSVTIADSGTSKRIVLTFDSLGFRVDSGRAPSAAYGTRVVLAGFGFTVTRRPGAETGVIAVLDEEAAARTVRQGIDGSPRKNSNIIDIEYVDESRETAVTLANQTVVAFQLVNARNSQQQSRRRREFIEEQLVRNDVQLAEAERALNAFRTSQAATVRSPGDLAAVEIRRQELAGERKLASKLLAGIRQPDSTGRSSAFRMLASSPELSNGVVAQRLMEQHARYQSQRLELTSGSWGNSVRSPEVQRLDTLIASTERQLAAALEAHIALLDSRIGTLDQLQSEKAGTLRQLPAVEANATRLSQNAEALREQASLLRTELQKARITEAAEIGQVDVIDLASRASRVSSGGMRFTAFAGILGLLLGCGLALVLELRDSSIRRRDDAEQAAGVPVLGMIPKMGPTPRNRAAAVMSRLTRENDEEEAGSLTQRRKVALATAGSWRSAAAEAHRQLRATVFHWYRPRRVGPQRIMITSANEGEGKTSIAVNFATALAQQGARVLLVDCDLHAPRLHRIMDMRLSPGLGEVLAGIADVDAATRPTVLAGLSLLTAGQLSHSPADALGGNRMRELIEGVSDNFDVIVFDTPPVLAVSDTLVLSAYADAVLMVVRLGKCKTMDLTEAMRHLKAVYAPVVGTVLNDPEGRAEQYGNYYYSYGSYGYAAAAKA